MILSYQKLFSSGELESRVQLLKQKLSSCTLCPRHCDADRNNDIEGFCKSGSKPLVASTVAHFGEEPVLVGSKGAGNVFFGSCNLRCVYCQNWQISHPNGVRKDEISSHELASRMIALQNQGCHNINFVSPSHFVAQLVEAVFLACQLGLNIPLVYNTNAYDDIDSLQLLDGIIDIYLPDIKYADDVAAIKYSQARDYKNVSRTAVKEMYRQVGNLALDENGLATRGMIVRHLILPNDLADSTDTLRWLSQEISPEVFISLMAQYYPTNKATRVPLLDRKIRESEYNKAVFLLEKFGLKNGWLQEFEANETYRPDFDNRERPFDNRELGF